MVVTHSKGNDSFCKMPIVASKYNVSIKMEKIGPQMIASIVLGL